MATIADAIAMSRTYTDAVNSTFVTDTEYCTMASAFASELFDILADISPSFALAPLTTVSATLGTELTLTGGRLVSIYVKDGQKTSQARQVAQPGILRHDSDDHWRNWELEEYTYFLRVADSVGVTVYSSCGHTKNVELTLQQRVVPPSFAGGPSTLIPAYMDSWNMVHWLALRLAKYHFDKEERNSGHLTSPIADVLESILGKARREAQGLQAQIRDARMVEGGRPWNL